MIRKVPLAKDSPRLPVKCVRGRGLFIRNPPLRRFGICQSGLLAAQLFGVREPAKAIRAEIQSDGGFHDALIVASIVWLLPLIALAVGCQPPRSVASSDLHNTLDRPWCCYLVPRTPGITFCTPFVSVPFSIPQIVRWTLLQ
jgi:hypothetical protein